jgi:hypothetical protein
MGWTALEESRSSGGVGGEWPCGEKQMHNPPPPTFHPHDSVSIVNGLSVNLSVLITVTVGDIRKSNENMETRLCQTCFKYW